MMHGDGKSGSAIVAMKPTNKAEQPAARSDPGAGGAKGAEAKWNAGQQSTRRAQYRESVSQEPARMRRPGAEEQTIRQ
jgi:hypothetical protein